MKQIYLLILTLAVISCKTKVVTSKEEFEEPSHLIELLKTKTVQEVLQKEGAKLLNLGNEELIYEDYDGSQILAISDSLARYDSQLEPLRNIKFSNGELSLGDFKYNFSTTKQFFRHYDKPDCLYLQLIDDYIKRTGLKKKVFMIYDFDEGEFALCIVPEELFERITYNLSKLETINHRSNPQRLEYFLEKEPRVIEFTGIINSTPHRIDIIIRKDE